MPHSRPRGSAVAVVLSLTLASACSLPAVRQAAPTTKPIAVDRVAIVAPDVAVVSAKPAKQVELKRQLLAAVQSHLGDRGQKVESLSDADANRVVRINVAHAKSSLHIYRELTGVEQKKPRRQLLPAEVRGVAEQSGADAVIITRLEGEETSTSQQIAQAATGFVGSAAIGVLTLSPGRLIGAALSAGDSWRATHLRVAVVDGSSGEVLWANWAMKKSSPSHEVVSELVSQAFSTFPRLVDRAPALASVR